MSEYAPSARRGFFAALPYVGVQVGAICAPLVVFALSDQMKSPQMTWLWRVPFLISIVIVGVALWIRLRLRETPTFAALEARHQVSPRPLRDLMTRSWRLVLVGIGLRVGEIGASSLYQVLAVSYLVKVAGQTTKSGTLCLLFAAMISAPVVVTAGALSDRLGRVVLYRILSCLQLVLAFPVWWVFSRGELWSSAIALGLVLGVATWGLYGTQASLLPELFGAQRRYIGVAAAREISAPLFGGTAPLVGSAIIVWSARALGSEQQAWIPLAAYAALLAAVTVGVTFVTPDARGRDLNLLEDAPLTLPWGRRK